MSEVDPERVQRVLTLEGSIPVGYAFLVDAVIYVWNPNAHFQRLALRSAELERACRAFLTAHNRVFSSLQHASAVATAERWLNWEKLQKVDDEDAGPVDPGGRSST